VFENGCRNRLLRRRTAVFWEREGPQRVDLSRSAHRRLRPIPSRRKHCLRRLEAVTSAYHKMKRQRHFHRAPRRFECLISRLVRPLRRYSTCVARRWTWLPNGGQDLGDLTVRPGHIFRHLKNDVIRNWKAPMPTRSIGAATGVPTPWEGIRNS
jgi:hypothetical protein